MIEYRTIDKSTWADGPWKEEPDKIQYVDETTGLPCLVKRHPRLGFLCGYVGVSEGHPLFGKSYSDDDDVLLLEAHCGVNYTAPCQDDDESSSICHIPEPGEPDHVWWFGFDCGHGEDRSPGMEADDIARGCALPVYGVYRTVEYVRGVNAHLALQLKELS